MKLTRWNLAHAQRVVAELLEAVIDAAGPLKLSKLEGDAALFWAPLTTSRSELDVSVAVNDIRGAFADTQARLIAESMCDCESCQQIQNLKIKFVAHEGEIALQKVKRNVELAGIDVILVHRMLKNDVPVSEVRADDGHAEGGAALRRSRRSARCCSTTLKRASARCRRTTSILPTSGAPKPATPRIRLARQVLGEDEARGDVAPVHPGSGAQAARADAAHASKTFHRSSCRREAARSADLRGRARAARHHRRQRSPRLVDYARVRRSERAAVQGRRHRHARSLGARPRTAVGHTGIFSRVELAVEDAGKAGRRSPSSPSKTGSP